MTENRKGSRDRRHYESLATGAALQARVAELESNEREYERIVGRKTYLEVADEIAQAQERVRVLEEEGELLRTQLVACGVASLQNTPESAAQRIQRSNPYWTASYGDVCAAVDREMSLRATLAAAIEQRQGSSTLDTSVNAGSIPAGSAPPDDAAARGIANTQPSAEILAQASQPEAAAPLTARNAALEEAAKVAETVQHMMWTKWTTIALEQFVLGRNEAAAAIRALKVNAAGRADVSGGEAGTCQPDQPVPAAPIPTDAEMARALAEFIVPLPIPQQAAAQREIVRRKPITLNGNDLTEDQIEQWRTALRGWDYSLPPGCNVLCDMALVALRSAAQEEPQT